MKKQILISLIAETSQRHLKYMKCKAQNEVSTLLAEQWRN